MRTPLFKLAICCLTALLFICSKCEEEYKYHIDLHIANHTDNTFSVYSRNTLSKETVHEDVAAGDTMTLYTLYTDYADRFYICDFENIPFDQVIILSQDNDTLKIWRKTDSHASGRQLFDKSDWNFYQKTDEYEYDNFGYAEIGIHHWIFGIIPEDLHYK